LIRADKRSAEELAQLVNSLFQSIQGRSWDHLPKEPDEDLISNWLVELRLEILHKKRACQQKTS